MTVDLLPSLDLRAAALVLALLLDRLVGEPELLWRFVRHPVVLMGAAVSFLDSTLNRPNRKAIVRRGAGAIGIFFLTGTAIIAGLFLSWLIDIIGLQFASTPAVQSAVVIVLEAVLAMTLLAWRSLRDHVQAVVTALRSDGLEAGRAAVSMIVGRDPKTLDEAGVSRAAVESCAENFSDGVVAPAFWYLVAGLPGLMAYKLLNTADSMIGHKTDKHLHFGWAAARLDDLANFIPARLTGILIALAAAFRHRTGIQALRTMMRDARVHASPNAGWPEAAMAGALDISLAGPRTYAGKVTSDPWLNPDGRRSVGAEDISSALGIAGAAFAIFVVLVTTIAAATLPL